MDLATKALCEGLVQAPNVWDRVLPNKSWAALRCVNSAILASTIGSQHRGLSPHTLLHYRYLCSLLTRHKLAIDTAIDPNVIYNIAHHFGVPLLIYSAARRCALWKLALEMHPYSESLRQNTIIHSILHLRVRAPDITHPVLLVFDDLSKHKLTVRTQLVKRMSGLVETGSLLILGWKGELVLGWEACHALASICGFVYTPMIHSTTWRRRVCRCAGIPAYKAHEGWKVYTLTTKELAHLKNAWARLTAGSRPYT